MLGWVAETLRAVISRLSRNIPGAIECTRSRPKAHVEWACPGKLEVDLEAQVTEAPVSPQSQGGWHARTRSLEEVPSLGEPASPRHKPLLSLSRWRSWCNSDGRSSALNLESKRKQSRPCFATELPQEEKGKRIAREPSLPKSRSTHELPLQQQAQAASSPSPSLRIGASTTPAVYVDAARAAPPPPEVIGVDDDMSDDETAFGMHSGGPSSGSSSTDTAYAPSLHAEPGCSSKAGAFPPAAFQPANSNMQPYHHHRSISAH